MGSSYSELRSSSCVSCLSKQFENAEATVRETLGRKESPVEWVQGYHLPSIKTSLADAKEDVLLLIAEGMQENGESTLCERANCLVTGRDSQAGYVMKVQWIAPAESEQVVTYLANPEAYDPRVLTSSPVSGLFGGITILRQTLKPQVGFAGGETAVATKWETLAAGAVLVFASAESIESEETARFAGSRGGYYAEQRGKESQVTGVFYLNLKTSRNAEAAVVKCQALALTKMVAAINQSLTSLK